MTKSETEQLKALLIKSMAHLKKVGAQNSYKDDVRSMQKVREFIAATADAEGGGA